VTLPITPTPSSFGDIFDSINWSPDSQQIVLSISHWPVNHQSTSTLYLINADTNEFHQLTVDDMNMQPVWSPDGKAIAYIKQDSASLGGKIYLLWLDKNCSTPMSETIVAKSLSWSPDGSRIAYENATKVYLFDVAKKLASGNLVGKACQ
jgi:Tol biopolymer transport system component